MTKITVEDRDEEAELVCDVGTFYFGADAMLEDDEECEWRFTYTRKDGTEVCSRTIDELGCKQFGYDDCPSVLLYGIGCMLNEGLIHEG